MLLIRDTYRLWANYMKGVAARAGVPDSYRMVLTFLLRNPGVSQKELAAHCGITTASVSQTVKEMGLTGYLKKEADDKDLRYVRLYLTEKGGPYNLAPANYNLWSSTTLSNKTDHFRHGNAVNMLFLDGHVNTWNRIDEANRNTSEAWIFYFRNK